MPYLDRIGLSEDRLAALRAVEENLGIDLSAVDLVLDSTDLDGVRNPIFRDGAFHLNVKTGGIEEMVPDYLSAIMEREGCGSVIWIAARYLTGPIPFDGLGLRT